MRMACGPLALNHPMASTRDEQPRHVSLQRRVILGVSLDEGFWCPEAKGGASVLSPGLSGIIAAASDMV